jgi:hypothetical protein
MCKSDPVFLSIDLSVVGDSKNMIEMDEQN